MAFICGSYTSTIFLGSYGAQLFQLSRLEMTYASSVTANIHSCMRGNMVANSNKLTDAINEIQVQNAFNTITVSESDKK